MNDEFEDVKKLVRLKRYERPPEGYFDEFLNDFHRRQRSELMSSSSRSLFFERLGTYLSSFGKQRWLFAGGAAYAVVMLVLALRPAAPPTGGESAGLPENFDDPRGQVTPVSASPLLDPEIDLLNGWVSPLESGDARAPQLLLQLEGAPRSTGETKIIEL